MPGMQVSLFSIEECCDSSGLPSGPQGAQASSAGGGRAQRKEHEKSAAEGLSDLAWSGEVHLHLSECVRSQLFGSARVSGGQQNLLRDLCNSMRSLPEVVESGQEARDWALMIPPQRLVRQDKKVCSGKPANLPCLTKPP